jgi:hypothetical protein
MTVQTYGGWPQFSAIELVVLVEPIGQNTTPLNHSAVVDLMDNISSAIRAETVGNLGIGALSWTLRMTSNEILGDNQYWAVIATVEGAG